MAGMIIYLQNNYITHKNLASAKLKKNPARKSEIILGIDEEAIHIFDRATERSIRK